MNREQRLEQSREKIRQLKVEADSEDNDIKAMAKDIKKIREIKALYFLEKIEPELKQTGFVINEFNKNCFRISDGNYVVDYYPKKGRLFIHTTLKWIDVKAEKVLPKIKEIFK